MSWNSKDIYQVELHPFETFVPANTNLLIIGTFPTQRNNFRFPFFYSGKENSFWSIIEQVFKHNFKHESGEKAVIERKAFLSDKEIGITDMHQMCYRKNHRSGDEYLYPIILQDIFSLLNQHPIIKRLVLTSRTEIFGALGLLKTYFLQNSMLLEEFVRRSDKILEGTFNHEGRKIEVLVPYSPSPRLKQNGTTTMDELVKMYSKCLR